MGVWLSRALLSPIFHRTVRSGEVKVAGAMALTIIRKETAMIERVITISFGLAHVCQLNLLIIP
jgi:hypothetical protein